MSGQGADGELVALRSRWRRWTAVVELYARRRPARRRVDPWEYARLHQGLLETCRKLAAKEDRRALCERLESLVQPWLSTRVLAQTDVEILQDLLLRGRQAEVELGAARRGRGWLWAAGIFCLVACAAALLVLAPPGSWQAALRQAQSWSDTAWFTVKNSTATQRMFVAGVVVTLAAIGLVTRAARRA